MIEHILKKRLVPVGVIHRVEDAIPLAEALLAGGLDILEVTLRTPEAETCIRDIRRKFPAMLVGAGTILDPAQIGRCLDAGAQFGVSPGLNEAVVRRAQDRGLPFIPGVMTPSEVERAMVLGCRLIKFFPAEAAGGIKMLQALAGPYAHTGVRFIPLGGIHASNARDYAALPMVGAIGGSWMLERKLVAEKNWARITQLVREALGLVAQRPD